MSRAGAAPNPVPHLVLRLYHQDMLSGRAVEGARLSHLIAGARVGESGTLVLRGDPGIGKTAMLDHAMELARGMQILRVAGSPAEREIPFAGLSRLLQPALHHLDALPAPQCEAISVALALRAGPEVDRFAVGAGTLGLLSLHAADRPLVVVVDDLHTLDRPSGEALAFAARRVMADPILMLFGTRPVADSPAEGLPTLELGGLTAAESRELVRQSIGQAVSDDAVARIHSSTGGNPLALIELARDRDWLEQLPPHTPAPVSEQLANAFARRFTDLDDVARAAVLLAVVADGDLSIATRAADALDADLAGLSAAEAIGLMSLTAGRATVRHPLVASAVYAAASAGERRRTHQAVAAAIPDDLDRRAWHRSAAVTGVDDDVATDLVGVGQRAKERSAYAVAATAWERSGMLASDTTLRTQRLVYAGECAWLAGQARRAVALLEQAEKLAVRPTVRGLILGLRGSIAKQAGSLDTARETLWRASELLAESDPDAAVRALADLVDVCLTLVDARSGLRAAERIEGTLRRGCTAESRILGQTAAGIGRVLAGRGGIDQIRAAVAELESASGWIDDPLRLSWPVLGALFLRESDDGRALILRAEGAIRQRCAITQLPRLLFVTARDDATTDRWASGAASYAEGAALAKEAGLSTDLALNLAGLAWLEARTGKADRCQDHAAEAIGVARQHRVHLAHAWALFALGDLALGRGDMAVALERFDELENLLTVQGMLDVDLSPGPEVVEALVRQGRRIEAHSAAVAYADRAGDKAQPWAKARAQRALALAAGVDQDAAFDEALALHRHSPDEFELARTRLAYGAALRRDRRRVASREQLRQALAVFERLGAEPWSAAAARELEATGEIAARRGVSRLDLLTPQELQIAQLLGAGRTTRQAAAALFLSPKTVEYHLRHVYTKLDVHSRPELTALLARPEPSASSRRL